jgi:hypothetical protein
MDNLPDRRNYHKAPYDEQQEQRPHNQQMRPQWVIVGIDLPDGRVRIVASDQLTHAALAVNYGWLSRSFFDDIGTHVMTRYEITLTIHMLNFRIVEAQDYATALADLFGAWKPERRIAIER